jgi:Lrp/AsnC family transcriptional regulator, leucine-responsive regulatory protein
MAYELDELDRGILDQLLRDARTPASQIAELVGLSRPAVAERIEKLERQGVIRGTTAVVDRAILGRGVTAFVSARGACLTPKARKVFDTLLAGDEIVEAHSVAGDDCYLIKVRTDSIASLNALVSRLTAQPLGLITRTTIVMETFCEKVGGIDLGGKR